MIAAIHETSPSAAPAVVRVGALLGEARELLRRLLAHPERREADKLAAGSRSA